MSTPEAVPASLMKLIKKRDTQRKGMVAVQSYVAKFDPSSKSLTQLQTRLDKLVQAMSAYDVIQSEIEDHDNCTIPMQDDRTEVDDFYCTLKAQILDLVEGTKDSGNTTDTHSHTLVRDSMKLPHIPAPMFDGNLQNWVSFLDSFNAMFHNNQGLSDVQRMHYLKSCLTGSAAEVIRTIPTTDDNYRAAYDSLIARYENKSLIIQSHIRSLLQSPQVSTPVAADLRRLHHHIISHVRALNALGQPIQHWDAWLVTLVCSRLDPTTVGEWQLRQTSRDLPSFVAIEKFLSDRIAAYEVGEVGRLFISNSGTQSIPVGRAAAKRVLLANHNNSHNNARRKCLLCDDDHRLSYCERFNNQSLSDRKAFVFNHRLCYNCLNPGHQVRMCRSSSCSKCNLRHHTKLHDDSQKRVVNPTSNETPATETNTGNAVVTYVKQTNLASTSSSSTQAPVPTQVMLATAIVLLADATGQPIPCRAVLDSGSQVCLITKKCAARLMLNKSNTSISIVGVSSTATRAHGMIKTSISSRFGGFNAFIKFHVIETITSELPSGHVNSDLLSIPSTVREQLADPCFHIPAAIDILLGAEIFFQLFVGETIEITPFVTLCNTTLGWIIAGTVIDPSIHQSSTSLLLYRNTESDLALTTQPCTDDPKNTEAEIHFKQTMSMDDHGRFVVRLPFAQDPTVLGDSKLMAQQRFYNLERRLIKNPTLYSDYNAFMKEYLDLGHMEVAKNTDNPSFYLPHHPVFKDNSSTTRMRIVFDGSAITRSGKSLNDIMLCGPIVQPSLFSIILRFRIHKIALTADIAKMYRQIRVAPEDCDMQRICYRETPSKPLSDYRLLTVTYGTRSASFLATRCLLELSYGVSNPAVRRSIQQDFYVDDLLSGSQKEEECCELFQGLSNALGNASLPLRKWCSNSKQLMKLLPECPSDPHFAVNLGEDDLINTLGLSWHPNSDCFRFAMKPWIPAPNMSKRSLLSDINSVFDPIGLVSPVLIKGKIFLQQLWSLKMTWDQQLPEDMRNRWINFYSNLQSLNQICIPRRVLSDEIAHIEIHAFSDASQSAYGSCIYIRTVDHSGVILVRLLTSKSRVAPLKPLTIPRLELCAALLAAELTNSVIGELKLLNITIRPAQVVLWSDSSIVIGWIQTKCLFQAYVSNRIARIRELSSSTQWRHVPTSDNPADLVSRGVHPDTLVSAKIWWDGPQWLTSDPSLWPAAKLPTAELPEVRKVKLVLSALHKLDNPILQRYSRWIYLLRITAWLCRFITNARLKPSQRESGPLSVQELQLSKNIWIRFAQGSAFSHEVQDLSRNNFVFKGSVLKAFNPFLDKDGLIRVGGRLNRAVLPYSQRHPLLLPYSHKVTELVFSYEHHRLLHAGPQALLAQVRRNYWPLKGKLIANRTVRHCITCFRFKPSLESPLMAPLPSERVAVCRPFSRSGVDFCGPVMIRSGIRRVASVKAYISVFVCFSTRAIHLELVTDLSTQTFLAALTRFMSRRGLCSHIHSDNGTNFVGASKVLKNHFKVFNRDQAVIDMLANQGIQWHFIPPAAPHFGGLWESAVKSAKHHLFKVTKGSLLKFEEMNTLLCRIEAILNSRPLTILSNDPSDLQALTPGHFLVGGPILLPDEPDVSNVPANRLKHFELVRARAQSFWKRWTLEYLPQLQRRGRWVSISRVVKVGDVAILKEDNLPPFHWKLVVVIEVHPGADGVVRVVTVRSSTGIQLRRPVVKLALLPNQEDEASAQV